MVRVWVAGKTVWSPCYTRAISERFRDKELIIKRYINSPFYFYFYFITEEMYLNFYVQRKSTRLAVVTDNAVQFSRSTR